MTNTATKTYLVSVVERAMAYYKVEAENPRAAAENWQDGEFDDRDDEALDSEGPCNIREQRPDGTWKKLAKSQWQDAPSAEAATVRYVIHSAAEDGYWSNDAGWGGFAAADVFNAAEQDDLSLPIGGQWAALKPFSVLLLYPDYANDSGAETYYAFVEAPEVIEAVTLARSQAVDAQEGVAIDADDFVPLLVTAGHHYGEPLFNK